MTLASKEPREVYSQTFELCASEEERACPGPTSSALRLSLDREELSLSHPRLLPGVQSLPTQGEDELTGK